jgi:hypothetical protein
MTMEKYSWEDAWLLLAIKYAQENNEVVTTEEAEKAGEYINQGLSEDGEIEHGISVLVPVGLLEVKDGNYKLGSSFQELWDLSGAEKYRGVQKQLEVLCKAMGIT